MNNNLYHWHDERMVDLEMRQVRQELGQAHYSSERGSSILRSLVGALTSFFGLMFRRKSDAGDRAGQRTYLSGKHKVSP